MVSRTRSLRVCEVLSYTVNTAQGLCTHQYPPLYVVSSHIVYIDNSTATFGAISITWLRVHKTDVSLVKLIFIFNSDLEYPNTVYVTTVL